MEILILGNSHAQEGINSNLMSQMLNAEVYNFSFSQQESAATYYSLKKLLEKNNPKTVILEAYTLIQKVEGAYDYMPLSLEKIKYYKMLGAEASFQDVFIPIIRLHNFWTNPNLIETILDNTNTNPKTT